MLLQFVVENFLSFRDPVTLSLLAAEGVAHEPPQVVRGPEGRDVLRCAAIYGANASGKSNLVRALSFALDLILEGTSSGRKIDARPFRLDPSFKELPSRFELEIGAGGRRFSYGFAITSKLVQAEWLFVGNGDGEQVWFERGGDREDDGPASRIRIGTALAADQDRRQFLGFVAEGTRPNQLFLTEAWERNVKELEPVLEALRAVRVIWPTAYFTFLADKIDSDPPFRKFLGEFLKGAGTGLEGIDVERMEWDGSKLQRDLLSALAGEHKGYVSDEFGAIRRSGADKLEELHLQGLHRGRDDTLVKLGLEEESDGTRRLLHLAPVLYSSTHEERGGAVYVIDELERSLHPLLTRLFIERFLATPTEGPPVQLIFTTHDTNLLDLSLLSRDSIWFTEKDPHGASALYSLAEFKAEQLEQLGAHLEKGYLQGRFGAIPFFGDPAKLRWTKKQGTAP